MRINPPEDIDALRSHFQQPPMTEPRIWEIAPPSLRSGPGVVLVVEAQPVAELLERLLLDLDQAFEPYEAREDAEALLATLREHGSRPSP